MATGTKPLFFLELQKNESTEQNPFTLRLESGATIYEIEISVTDFALLMQNERISAPAHKIGSNTPFKVGDRVATNATKPPSHLGYIARLTRRGAVIDSRDSDIDGEEYTFDELVLSPKKK